MFISSLLAFAIPALLPAQDGGSEKAFHQGTAAMRNGQWEAAAADFALVIAEAPGFAEAYFNLGLVRLQQGRFDEAVASLGKSVALKPHLRGANLFLGQATSSPRGGRPAAWPLATLTMTADST